MQEQFRGGLLPRELSISVAGNTNVVLSNFQARHRVLSFTGLLTGSITVTFPVLAGDEGLVWIIDNATTGAFTLGVKDAAGSTLDIVQGTIAAVLWNGTGMAVAESGQLTLDADIADVVFTSTARGDIIRRGATAWNNLSAKAAGAILVGDGTDVVTLDAKGSAKILIGNGTTLTSATVSGEATIGATGIVTLADELIHSHPFAISSALLKGIRNVAQEIVPTPGPGKVLEFLSATLILDYGSEGLTENGCNLAVRYGDKAGPIVSQDVEATGFIDQTADTLTRAVPKTDGIAAKTACVDKPLVLHNVGGEEIAGNATNDSVLRVITAYRILTPAWA